MALKLSDPTLKRAMWLQAATNALLDYRPPGSSICSAEQTELVRYLDLGFSPAGAAEAYQARTP